MELGYRSDSHLATTPPQASCSWSELGLCTYHHVHPAEASAEVASRAGLTPLCDTQLLILGQASSCLRPCTGSLRPLGPGHHC